MATHNLPHMGRKFTHEAAKAARKRRKEQRRQQEVGERLAQPESGFKKENRKG